MPINPTQDFGSPRKPLWETVREALEEEINRQFLYEPWHQLPAGRIDLEQLAEAALDAVRQYGWPNGI